MENKVKDFYDNMCNNCQKKFKKVISIAKKNVLKHLDDLELFLCHVDKTRNIDEDNGVVPLAFIFCKNDSYAFFWKDALYNGDGSSKVKVVNNTITLSQATIDRIKEGSMGKNQLVVVKKEETQAIATQILEKYNMDFEHKFNRKLASLTRQHFLHMCQKWKKWLSVLL
ncbi:hypothetical protein [Spiroplasma chrysopicola]|uniref:Uncharacterized protein n=1 Tax=Spiroplasma chrysopicola DF-1 TaxID=1276227 RepID=R4UFU3_9MOLU|nr:hypothetical protein [Spiroplasma chrysopicola]AGM25030.1 hypothetical protein SCHRY_v1c04490 [Spiroplasma chrysopicola DF-1]